MATGRGSATSARSNQPPPAADRVLRPLIHEAAALLVSVVQNHPFVDGNKRVAFAAVDVFLRINGYAITASSITIYNDIMKLFKDDAVDMEHLVPWLQEIAQAK